MTSEKPSFFCDVCQKSYTRVDHLGRHRRTHTNERPFACELCGKAFTRIDLLRRHRNNHLQDGHPAKRFKQSGQRAIKACVSCAESKLKCGDEHPCSRCVAKGIVCRLSRTSSSRELVAVAQPTEQHRTASGNSATNVTFDESAFSAGPNYDIVPGQLAMRQFPTPDSALSNNTLLPGDQHDLPELPMDDFGLFDDTVMGSFLFDIMNPTSDDAAVSFNPGPLPDVLNFAFDDFLDPQIPAPTDPYTFGPQMGAESQSKHASGDATPTGHKAIRIGRQAFQDSVWLWTPNSGDNRLAEQSYLAISDDNLMEAGISPPSTAGLPKFSQSSRDRLLSMILRSCEPSVQRQTVSCFPSASSLSFIMNLLFTQSPYEVRRWIHLPSLQVDGEREEFLSALLATAAASSDQPSLRRLGFAVQEAARFAISFRFEEDNRNTRDLRTIQSSALLVHVGLWSGSRRKMEIAESFAYPLITMVRRSGRFRGSAHESLSDHNNVTEETWRQWLETESFKRLAYHLLLQDTAVSMSFVTQPLISYTEIYIPLPCSNNLWQAASVDDFREELDICGGSHDLPTLRDCLKDLEVLSQSTTAVDKQMSLDIIVSTFWSRVWQYRQIANTPMPTDEEISGSTASNLYQDLLLMYRHLQMQEIDFDDSASCWKAKLELCMIHLHVSLEDIQLFAGKEGESEARRVVPLLRKWFNSSASRQALRHAGQVLKAASRHRTGPLPGLSAVAVYHASLAMWAYGICSERYSESNSTAQYRSIVLDADNTTEWEPFLLLGKGKPCIQNHSRAISDGTGLGRTGPIPLERPLDVMKSIIALLTSKCGDMHSSPPMVATLSKLMLSLGKAATATQKANF